MPTNRRNIRTGFLVGVLARSLELVLPVVSDDELAVPCQEPERSALVDGEALREQINSEWNATVELTEARIVELEADLVGYRRALVAHHDLATLSDDVIREYDWRECPVCARARKQ